jgi:tryptophan synthase alpha subunit
MTSQKNEDTGETEVQIHFSKESKGSVYYVTRNPETKVKKERSPKLEETEKKIKREEE